MNRQDPGTSTASQGRSIDRPSKLVETGSRLVEMPLGLQDDAYAYAYDILGTNVVGGMHRLYA